MLNKKSDNSFKIIKLKTSKIGLFASLGIYTKKAPLTVRYQKWCGLLCGYRTKNYEEFKDMSRKIEVLRDIDVS